MEESVASARDLVQDVKRFRDDALFVQENRDRFLEQFPDRWIGVYQREIVGVARTAKELVAKLNRKGILPGQAYFAFLATQEDARRTSSWFPHLDPRLSCRQCRPPASIRRG